MASLLCLGTAKGVVTLKSKDHRSWEITSQALTHWSVTEVAVSPTAPNRVFAGTRGDGVWLSEDAGASWKKPSYGKRGPTKVRCLTMDPSDPDTLYAGNEPIDAFVSRDAGKNWARMDSVWTVPAVASIDYPVSTVEPHIRDIAIDPKDPTNISLALQVGYILKSTDGGESWKLQDRDLDSDVHTIVIDPENTDTVYVATGGHDCRSGRVKGRALYKSIDGGESWSPTGLEFPQEYSIPLVMHPQDPAILYSAMANGNPGQWRRPSGAESTFVRTRDGGKSWQKMEKGLGDISKDFPHAIVIDEDDPDRLYMVPKSGELYLSEDGGDSWTKLDVRVPDVQDMRILSA